MKVPRHIAIILDGNRRYSKKKKLQWWKGHELGAKKVEELFLWCKELGVKELTLYVFSTENFNRPKKEIDFLMDLFLRYFNQLLKDKPFEKNKTRMRFIGRLELFPKKVQEAIEKLEESTKDYDGYTVNMAMGYGGRAEIVDAIKKISHGVKEGNIKIDDIDEELVSKNLYLQDDPELLIRPGGEFRISNFLTWESSYTELWFTEKLWPEFTKNDLKEAIDDYNERERRFGV